MMSQCNFIPETIWIRESDNGIRHITLRRNFIEEILINENGKDKQFNFEETDVFIPDRDNIEQFITENFGNLFDLGLQQTEERQANNEKIQRTNQIINDGTIIDDLQSIGQQITNIMLFGV